VIRLSGDKAIHIANDVFKGNNLSEAAGYSLHFGIISDGVKTLDEVLLSLFKNPKSYTGEDLVEISCHGSPFILSEVLQLLITKGARLAEPGEFTLRAFLNGKMDLSQAEAVADLIASDSEASHRLAMDQMRGGFKARIESLRKELIHFASMIELELDFGEEDVEFADRLQLKALVDSILKIIHELIGSFKYGNVLKNGIYTVIAGRPNAGKSTLLNGLLKEDRAIVSDIEGTTRDTIEDILNIDGMIFRLVDTAGIREAKDQIEAQGIERTMHSIGKSSMMIYVFDSLRMPLLEVQSDLEKLGLDATQTVLIANKTDELISKPEILEELSELKQAWPNFISMSAKAADEMEQLTALMRKMAEEHIPQEGDVVVSNARHLVSLRDTQDSLYRVIDGLASGLSSDLVAFDIRQALHHLGLITGEVTTDDLLENIFRNFCIGK
jgi:tRNA modification GTPase